MSLSISSKRDGDVLTLCLSGRLETTTSPIFQDALDAIGDDVFSLIVDLAELDYTSSAGLRCFIIAHKRFHEKGGLKIIHVCPEVMEIFDMTGFTDILEISQ